MWLCEVCNTKNNNSAKKCHGKFCKAEKPLDLVKQEQEKNVIVRDYCPKCMSHQDFKQVGNKKFKCPRCKRSFKFNGKPVEEKEQVLKDNTVVTVEN